MDPAEVRACLECGVNVNCPINKQGNTILDLFAMEHQNMLKTTMSTRGRPEDTTRLFCEMQASAAEVLSILRRHGALMSGQSAALRRGV
mmetsp:Transcript_78950/g.228211  ORF Transcript_78950/g.228211 Transcript_78950/m.228211 type:complete len:89 (+) Transcript_78950:66-332(+)